MAHEDTFIFLFADKDEIYFTEHLLKLNLDQYLYYQLRSGKAPFINPLETVFFLERVNKEVMNIYCERECACDIYLNHIPKDDSDRKKTGGILGIRIPYRSNVEVPKPQFKKSEESKRYVLQQDTKSIRETIKNLITEKNDDKYGFVFGEDAFATLYSINSVTSDFFPRRNIEELGTTLEKERHASQFILVEPLNSRKKLPYLPAIIVPEGVQNSINDMEEQDQLFSSVIAGTKNRSCESLKAWRWDFNNYKQLKCMLLRACISNGYIPQDLDQQEKKMIEVFKSSQSERVFGEEIRTRKDWFKWLTSSENMQKLISEIKKMK